MYKELSDKDWNEVEQTAYMKLWNNDWQEEEVEEPDTTLRDAFPDFIAEDGHGRSVLVLVKIIRHPIINGSS
jgi:hypothetical protein